MTRQSRSRPGSAAVDPVGQSTDRGLQEDRAARLRLLAVSAVGVGCLLLSQLLQPDVKTLFGPPTTFVWWIAVIFGITGVSLVPGQWMTAFLMRPGAGPATWLATWIGTTLAWYALVPLVLYRSAGGVDVTTAGIIGATAGATAAVCLGVVLGLWRRPTQRKSRILLAGAVGVVLAQSAIALSMGLWTNGMSLALILRLDLLIVVASASLTILGMLGRPELPSMHTVPHTRTVIVALLVTATTIAGIVVVGNIWSTAQRYPSSFSIEQIPAPEGTDLAFTLTPVGPEGSAQIPRAAFTASDDIGRRVGISERMLVGDKRVAHPQGVTMLVMLDPGSRPVLCERVYAEHSDTVKLTLRDQVSGALVQGTLRRWWCAV